MTDTNAPNSDQGQTNGAPTSPVCSWNEWDPLEEVIVGTPLGAYVHVGESNPHIITNDKHIDQSDGNMNWGVAIRRAYDGTPFPAQVVLPAHQQIENFAAVLQAEGVTVKRPDPINLGRTISTPFWEEHSGYNVMNPRDHVMIVGDQIIESATPVRRRYFEKFAYRRLFRDYHRRGARWVSAPMPTLDGAAFDMRGVAAHPSDDPFVFMTTEYEPVFDAASFVRCGRDIFAMRDHATNYAGIRWVQQHLGSEFNVHVVDHRAKNPMHIDVVFMPLAPGKVLVNPEFIGELPECVKKWDVLRAPKPDATASSFFGFPRDTTSWISMNVFSIDEERVCVEENQTSLIKALKDWGFKPVPLPFTAPPMFGGGFHCATLDIRRRGTLQSYF